MEGSQEDRPLDDTGLVALARQGDARAYAELVRRYQDIAFRTAWAIAGTTGEAEDAAQTAFVKAYRGLGRFRRGAPFRPWLLAIVANEARNRLRSAGRRTDLELRLRADAVPLQASAGTASSAETAVGSRLAEEALLAAVNRLPLVDRQVITCRYFLELSEAETATALGWAKGTVKSRLSRSLGRLRVALAEAQPSEPAGPAPGSRP
jgi:RNA polymerase sigma factor (sigma-70 family)